MARRFCAASPTTVGSDAALRTWGGGSGGHVTEWFEEWFGEEYLHLYAHRDQQEARDAAQLLARVAPWEAGARVLDLACGSGRHARELVARGAWVVGYDLSRALLHRARSAVASPLVRGDMRALPFEAARFDLAVSLFTSFGYFAEETQDRAVLTEVARVVRRGGRFVLDFLHAARVRSALVPHEEMTLDGRKVAIERRLSDDGCFVVKEIHLLDQGRSFVERVRLYTAEELGRMFDDAGFRVERHLGGYDGAPLTAAAPRVILVGTRR